MINKIGNLELIGMEFHSYHGCLENERAFGNKFIVDFISEFDMSSAGESDNLDDTINYAIIYDLISKEMEKPSMLLEHIATRIAKSIAKTFQKKINFSVKVSKSQPPVSGKAAWSSVTISGTSNSPISERTGSLFTYKNI